MQDVKEGDLWYFPAGLPHSLQGLGPDGAEFVLAFDNGTSSEFNTLPATDWMAHTPPDVLAKNFGVPAEAFSNIPLQNRWIFQGKVPGPLAEAQAAVASKAGAPEFPFIFSLADAPPAGRNQERLRADRRQLELPGLEDHRGGPGHGQAGRPADDALASERRRVAVLHQGVGPHDGVQCRAGRPTPPTSTPATSAT